jgi:hypothetical protein
MNSAASGGAVVADTSRSDKLARPRILNCEGPFRPSAPFLASALPLWN